MVLGDQPLGGLGVVDDAPYLGGDEFARSQEGNNNAYCQDNEISWINWELGKTEEQLYFFVARIIKLRREQFNLRMARATGQAAKPDQFAKVRKNIARVKTVLAQSKAAGGKA